MFALFKVKKWSNFFVLYFCFRKSRSPCRKKRIFEKKTSKKNNNKKTQFLKLKSGPIMLRNRIGPILTLTWTTF